MPYTGGWPSVQVMEYITCINLPSPELFLAMFLSEAAPHAVWLPVA